MKASHQILIAPDWRSAEAWLLDRILPHLRQSPVPTARVVVPSGTLVRHLEECLLTEGVDGFFGQLFTTLSGLLREILEAAPQEERLVRIPEALRLWSLARLVRREVAEDGPMGQVRDFPGFVAASDALVQELEEAGIEPEALIAMGADRRSPRLQELGRLYAGYQRMLCEQGWTDGAGEERRAVEILRSSEAVLRFEPLILYGFDEFTGSRFEVIQALAETHPGILFVIPFDSGRGEAFSSARATLERLQEITGASLEKAQPVEVPCDSALSFVQRKVFSLPSDRHESPSDRVVEGDDSLQVLTASGPAQMVEAIARELRRARRADPDLAWRDCAVVFRNLSAYRRLIQEIFPRFGVPYALPVGTPWAEIRVLALVRKFLELKSGGFPRDLLLDCLRSAYCRLPVDLAAVEQLSALLPSHVSPERLVEHLHCLAEGMAQRAEEPDEEGEGSEALRERAAPLREAAEEVAALSCLSELPDQASLAEYAARLEAVARALIRLPDLSEETLRSPDARSIARDRHALAELLQLLRGLGQVWPHEVPFEEFLLLFSFLLQEGLLYDPLPRTDAVAIHDPLAVRGLSFRIVVAAGLLEREFPAGVSPGPFLKEAEREDLSRRAGPGRRLLSQADRMAKERLVFAAVLEAARERLYLAYTEADAEGRPAVVSPFVEEVRSWVKADPGSGIRMAAQYEPADVLPRGPSDLWHVEEAAAWTIDRLYRSGEMDPEGAAVLWDLLKQGQPPGLAAELARWHDPEFTSFDGVLSKERAIRARLRQRWASRPLSPTRLDLYGQCPWQFFASQVLELSGPEREEVEISPLDRGRLFHRILERFYGERREGAGGWVRPLSREEEAAAVQAIHRIAEEECERLQGEGGTGHPGAWRYEKERLMIRLEWFVRSEIAYFAKNPGVAPAHLEFSFGMREQRGRDPASTAEPLVLSRGRLEVRLRGVIDRVDVSPDGKAWVIDYKTGSSGPPGYSSVASGTSFQLFAYLLAVRDLLGFDPVAGFYLMVAQPPGARGGLSQKGRIACGEKPVRKGQLAWPELQDRLLAFLEAYSSDIRKGHFPLLPASPGSQGGSCQHCDFCQVCRLDEVRLFQGKQTSARRFARTRVREEDHG